MGYHVYDLAEFSLSAVGSHHCYLYLFCQEAKVANRFAEDIGERAVSITGGIDGVDWFFASDRPTWLSPHAYFYATICVVCPRKAEAEKFLRAYKQFRDWSEDTASSIESVGLTPAVSLTNLDNVMIVSIPRTHNPDYADFMGPLTDQARAHDVVLGVLAKLVRTGLAGEAAIRGAPDLIAERIRVLSRIETYVHDNAVLVDTLGGSVIPIDEQRKTTLVEIREELSAVKKVISVLPQNREVQGLMRQLRDLNKALTGIDFGKRPLSVQATVGFEAFGNGVKLVFDSNGLSTNPITRIRHLLSTFQKLHEPGADKRHLLKP
jgi:hypothetical protein